MQFSVKTVARRVAVGLIGMAAAATAVAEPGWRCITETEYEAGSLTTFLVGTKSGEARLNFANFSVVLRDGSVSNAQIMKVEDFFGPQPGVFSLKADVKDEGLSDYRATLRVPGLKRNGSPIPTGTLQLLADGDVIADTARDIVIPEEDFLDPFYQYQIKLTPVASMSLLSAKSASMRLADVSGDIVYDVALPIDAIDDVPRDALRAMPDLKARLANGGQDCDVTEIF